MLTYTCHHKKLDFRKGRRDKSKEREQHEAIGRYDFQSLVLMSAQSTVLSWSSAVSERRLEPWKSTHRYMNLL